MLSRPILQPHVVTGMNAVVGMWSSLHDDTWQAYTLPNEGIQEDTLIDQTRARSTSKRLLLFVRSTSSAHA